MDSDYDSNSSTSSLPAEPVASFHAPPSVEQLVQYFVAAKRSLSSISFIQRADELVTNARALVEEIAHLNARNSFVREGVDEQVDTLHAIRDSIVVAGDDSGEEFRQTIARLDQANDKLQRTLEALKKTTIDAALQNHIPGKRELEKETDTDDEASLSDTTEESKGQTLYDFIDESSHVELQTSLRRLIDDFYESRSDLNTTIQNFEEILKNLQNLLSGSRAEAVDQPSIDDNEPPLTIPHTFRSISEHAAEMATLLHNLISHYDLCVSALKHTEGGGEAAKRAIQQADDALVQNEGGVEESLYVETVAKPISDEDRNEMLRVVGQDAQEVEDVMTEIRERNVEQEAQFSNLSRQADRARFVDKTLGDVVSTLHELHGIHLPSYQYAISTFQSTWSGIRTAIHSQTSELAALSTFYDSFLIGYAKLLREIDRREAAKAQMRKVAEKAQKELKKLGEADVQARSDFMEEVGRYLPQGIWEGLREDEARWEVKETR